MTLSLHAVTTDCADAHVLATFWSAVLDRPVADGANEDFAVITGDGPAPSWFFIKVPEPKQVKNRVHADLLADDRQKEVDRVVALGATALGEFDESGAKWTTLTDPEGNEFDIAEL